MQMEKSTKGEDDIEGDWVSTGVTANTFEEFELRHPNDNAQ